MKRVFLLALIAGTGLIAAGFASVRPAAAQNTSGFSIQVTPSPLVATVKPGETANLELKIRNTGTTSDKLVMEPRSFRINNTTGEVELQENTPPEIVDWLTFSEPTMSLKPGEIRTQKLSVAVPEESGFSYSFALIIRRAEQAFNPTEGRQLQGSVAVFVLLNVDRPGATRKIELTDVTTSQNVYEFLPVTIKLKFKNSGNTIAQPYGNVFIQRDVTDTAPLGTLPVNDKRGYILPGSVRTLDTQWKDGFAVYQTVTDASGKQTQKLVRNPDKLSKFRFGKYTAKVVAVYNDGFRDVPLEKTVTFWVVPWRALGALLLVLIGSTALIVWLVRRRTARAIRKALETRDRSRE